MFKKGDNGGQFLESDIDAEDYANLLLSPARPRRHLEQLEAKLDSKLGDKEGNSESDNDSMDGSPLCRLLLQPSAQLRRTKPRDTHLQG